MSNNDGLFDDLQQPALQVALRFSELLSYSAPQVRVNAPQDARQNTVRQRMFGCSPHLLTACLDKNSRMKSVELLHAESVLGEKSCRVPKVAISSASWVPSALTWLVSLCSRARTLRCHEHTQMSTRQSCVRLHRDVCVVGCAVKGGLCCGGSRDPNDEIRASQRCPSERVRASFTSSCQIACVALAATHARIQPHLEQV